MEHKIDLQKYTDYQTIGKALEFTERVISEEIELGIYWNEIDLAQMRQYILSADEIGIRRWEALLRLTPTGNLEERRKRVYLLWNKTTLWTDRTLRQYLDVYLGVGTYVLTIVYNEYGLIIDINVSNRDINADLLFDDLRHNIIPANLTIDIRFRFDSDIYIFSGLNFYDSRVWRCGEVKCGILPYVTNIGDRVEEPLIITAGDYTAKVYPKRAGQLKAAKESEEVDVYDLVQIYEDFDTAVIYELGGEFS